MTEVGPAGVTITVKDIWEQGVQTQHEVTATRGEVQAAMATMRQIQERNEGADEKHDDYETRLRSLEKYKYLLMGGMVLLSSASGFIEYALSHSK